MGTDMARTAAAMVPGSVLDQCWRRGRASRRRWRTSKGRECIREIWRDGEGARLSKVDKLKKGSELCWRFLEAGWLKTREKKMWPWRWKASQIKSAKQSWSP